MPIVYESLMLAGRHRSRQDALVTGARPPQLRGQIWRIIVGLKNSSKELRSRVHVDQQETLDPVKEKARHWVGMLI